jgi:hypothetical protein
MASLNLKKNKTLCSLLGVAVVAAGVWFILFGASTFLSKELVQSKLADMSREFASLSQRAGNVGKFTYGEIAVEGWFLSKHAVVRDVAVEVAEGEASDARSWKLAADEVHAKLDVANTNRFLVSAPGPLTLSFRGVPSIKVALAEPFTYGYLDSQVEGARTIEQRFELPTQLTLSDVNVSQTADSANPADKQDVLVTFSEKPVLTLLTSPETKTSDITYNLKNMVVKSGETSNFTLGEVDARVNQMPSAEGRIAANYVLKVKDAVLYVGDRAFSPYELNINIATDAQEVATPPADGTEAPNSLDMSFNDVSLVGKDFALRLTGKLSGATNDPLLFGGLTFKVEGVQPFLNSDLLPAFVRPLVTAVLEKSSGQKLDGITDLPIALKREKNGVFYVGQVTFEELAAVFVTGLMTMDPAAAAAPVELTPADGAKDKPAAEAPAAPMAPTAAPASPEAAAPVAVPAPIVAPAPVAPAADVKP